MNDPVRDCKGCGTSIEHLSIRAIYCGAACRSWVRNGHTELRVGATSCLRCGASMVGKLVTAVYCTKKCKMAAVEERRPRRDDAARYQAERLHRLEAAKAYYRRRPEVAHATKVKRKALLRGAGMFKVRPSDWTRLCARHDHRCFYCGQRRPLTMDHVIPVVRGGVHSIGNLIPACMSCNASKNYRTIMEWRVAKLRRGGDSRPLEAIGSR